MKKYRILFRLNASRIMDFYTHDFNLAHQWVSDLGFHYEGKGDLFIRTQDCFEVARLTSAYKHAWWEKLGFKIV